jgi:hypothetical protein
MKQTSLCIGALTLLAALNSPLYSRADNVAGEERFWLQYIEACSPASSLNNHAHFLGPSNPIGPGSVWGLASGTTNLVAPQESYLGPPDVSGKFKTIEYATASADCEDKGTRTWDFSLGLPISIVSASDSANVGVALKNSKAITVAIKSVQIDSVPVALWEDAATKITDHSSSVYMDAVDGKHYLLNTAVAVTGLTITFTPDSSQTASLKANIQAGTTVNVGTQSNPVTAQVDVGNSGQSVTLTVPDRIYILGQFLRIDKIAPSKQDSSYAGLPPSSLTQSSPPPTTARPKPLSHLHVTSEVPML